MGWCAPPVPTRRGGGGGGTALSVALVLKRPTAGFGLRCFWCYNLVMAKKSKVRGGKASRELLEEPKRCPECERFTRDWYNAAATYCRPCFKKYQRLQYHVRKHRERLMVKQKGLCKLCKKDLRKLKAKAIHVDHVHGTMKIRGLLCISCNTGLGNFRDDPKLLRRAADYLEKTPAKELE